MSGGASCQRTTHLRTVCRRTLSRPPMVAETMARTASAAEDLQTITGGGDQGVVEFRIRLDSRANGTPKSSHARPLPFTEPEQFGPGDTYEVHNMVRGTTNLIAVSVGLGAVLSVVLAFVPGVLVLDRIGLDSTSSRGSVVIQDIGQDIGGDQLPSRSTDKMPPNSPLPETVMPKPPLGCDPAVSPIANPSRVHVFGRCAV